VTEVASNGREAKRRVWWMTGRCSGRRIGRGPRACRTDQRDEARAHARKASDYFHELSRTDSAAYGSMAQDADKLVGILQLEATFRSLGGVSGAKTEEPVERVVTRGLTTGVSPVLSEFGRVLGDGLPAAMRNQYESLMASLPGTADVGVDERRRYMALDWLIRYWLPTWLAVLPNGRAGATSLRQHAPIIDSSAAEQAESIVRQAVWVPGLPIGSDYVSPSLAVTPEQVASHVVENVAKEATKAAGWDAAYAIAPDDARCRKILGVALNTACQISGHIIRELIYYTVRDAVECIPDRRSRWTLFRDTIRGYSTYSPAADPYVYEAGTKTAWALLTPVIIMLQSAAVDLFYDMIREGSQT
jgi:hypothetical protein